MAHHRTRLFVTVGGLILAASAAAVTPAPVAESTDALDPALADPMLQIRLTPAGETVEAAAARLWEAYFRQHLRYSHALLTPWPAIPHEPVVRVD
jgi:hypothetical protein